MAKPLDLLLITDSEEHQGSLDRVISRVAEADIGWKSAEVRILAPDEIEQLNEVSQDVLEEDEFNEKYSKIRDHADREKLLLYSRKTNSKLFQNLSSGMQINKALWLAYKDAIANKGWDSVLNYQGVLVDEASKREYPNVLEVLFNHNVIAVDFGAPETIPYHMIGRGFVAEGCHWPLWNKDGKDTGKKAILLPLGLYNNQADQVSCAYELINHEIVGHAVLGLRDHSIADVNPQECIMSIPDSRESFVELARLGRGLVFCGDCKAVYRKSPIYILGKEQGTVNDKLIN